MVICSLTLVWMRCIVMSSMCAYLSVVESWYFSKLMSWGALFIYSSEWKRISNVKLFVELRSSMRSLPPSSKKGLRMTTVWICKFCRLPFKEGHQLTSLLFDFLSILIELPEFLWQVKCSRFRTFAAWPLFILSSYRILDNLPVAMVRKGDRIKTYDRGFPVGFKASFDTVRFLLVLFRRDFNLVISDIVWMYAHCILTVDIFLQKNKDEKFFIFNHLSFVVSYHNDAESTDARIVGFEVTPFRSVTLHTLKEFC